MSQLSKMKKYRYTDPKSPRGRRHFFGQLVKFFIGWNIMGYCVWSYLKYQHRKKDPDIDKKSRNQQVLSMMGYDDDQQRNVYRLKISSSGISLKKEESNDNTTEGDQPDISDNTKDESAAER